MFSEILVVLSELISALEALLSVCARPCVCLYVWVCVLGYKIRSKISACQPVFEPQHGRSPPAPREPLCVQRCSCSPSVPSPSQ